MLYCKSYVVYRCFLFETKGWGTIKPYNKEKAMKDLQSIFNHIQEMKKDMKTIKREYADTLANADDLELILEELKKLKERKRQIEIRVQEQMGKRYAELEELKDEVESEQQMLNDIAMTTLMDGKTVEVMDEYQNRYEPLFSVKFKKA